MMMCNTLIDRQLGKRKKFFARRILRNEPFGGYFWYVTKYLTHSLNRLMENMQGLARLPEAVAKLS